MNEPTNRREIPVIKGLWALFAAVIIGFLGGVGTFQMLISGEVREHSSEIRFIKEKAKEAAEMTELRMANVVKLLESNAKLSSELVSTVREQNALIERYYMNQMKGVRP